MRGFYRVGIRFRVELGFAGGQTGSFKRNASARKMRRDVAGKPFVGNADILALIVACLNAYVEISAVHIGRRLVVRGLGAFFRRAVEYPFQRVSEQIAVAFLRQSRRFVFVGSGTDYDFSFIFAD